MTVWHGCYEKRWRGLIVPEAMAHPAKMSRSLIERIFDQLIETHVLGAGSVVVDPFGGVGTTGIEAASRGIQAISCELEPKFFQLALQNYAMHADSWKTMGFPLPIIVNGDSRKLIENIASHVPDHLIVDEPTPEESELGWWSIDELMAVSRQPVVVMSKIHGDDLRVDAIVSSPPYEEIAAGAGGLNTRPPKHEGQQGGRSSSAPSQDTDQRYGSTPGQLAKLPRGAVDAVVSSPPFTQGYSGGGGINKTGITTGDHAGDQVGERSYQGTGAERSDGNLESLPLGSLLSFGYEAIDPRETFWHAARMIVEECYALLRPGGVAVWVVKAFVKNKQIVDFPGDWRTLCEAVGFETVEEVHASLVEHYTENTLFDGERAKTRERKSFFRRLAEKKGSPRIDHEVVWYMVKPHAIQGSDSQSHLDGEAQRHKT